MEISQYEQRRNAHLLQMNEELRKRLQESGFSDPVLDARILQGSAPHVVVTCRSAGTPEWRKTEYVQPDVAARGHCEEVIVGGKRRRTTSEVMFLQRTLGVAETPR
jgi:hypothetical protein